MDAGLDSLKTAYKKVVHKAGEIIENRIAEPATKSNDNKQEPVEEIIIPPEEKRWNIKQIEKSVKKFNTI